jgi:Protein of unknown function (DUF4876)
MVKLVVGPRSDEVQYLGPLDWAEGIPGVQVVLSSTTTPNASPLVATADGQGMITYPAIAPGEYRVEARRLLSSEERLAVGRDSDLRGFLGVATLNIPPRDDSLRIAVTADRIRSVVISEVQPAIDYAPGIGDYGYAQYIELYNNGDSTVYLDHLIVGHAEMPAFYLPPVFTCADAASYTLDPRGYWAYNAIEFPGNGHDHPLAPGATAVIAEDAIDHTQFDPRAPDLSHADFETVEPGGRDIDNPAVPNMIYHCWGTCRSAYGHGLFTMDPIAGTVFVAGPIDPDTLLQGVTAPNIPPVYAIRLIERGALYDSIQWEGDYPPDYWLALGIPPCDPFGNPALDRAPAVLLTERDFGFTMHRRLLELRPQAGAAVLQHTMSSAQDFVRAPMSPGRITP